MYEKADQLYAYHIGDEVKVNGIDFYVIADSPATQDYVIALASESIERMKYGSSQDYNSSGIKTYIENWVESNFANNALKEVNGYKSRLITSEEYLTIPDTCDWRHLPNAGYWTMSKGPSGMLFKVNMDGTLGGIYPTALNNVRPVVNIYKSAIQKTN